MKRAGAHSSPLADRPSPAGTGCSSCSPVQHLPQEDILVVDQDGSRSPRRPGRMMLWTGHSLYCSSREEDTPILGLDFATKRRALPPEHTRAPQSAACKLAGWYQESSNSLHICDTTRHDAGCAPTYSAVHVGHEGPLLPGKCGQAPGLFSLCCGSSSRAAPPGDWPCPSFRCGQAPATPAGSSSCLSRCSGGFRTQQGERSRRCSSGGGGRRGHPQCCCCCVLGLRGVAEAGARCQQSPLPCSPPPSPAPPPAHVHDPAT